MNDQLYHPLELHFDMDGVITDMLQPMVYRLNRYHGEELTPEMITEWEIHSFCKNAKSEDVYKYFEEPGFFRHSEPLAGAISTLTMLHQAGHNITLVTHCKKGHECKQAWVATHLPFLDIDADIIFAKKKWKVRGDVFVDDYHRNLQEYRAHNPDTLTICYNQPYNAGEHKWDGLRADTWRDVFEMIQNHSKEISLKHSLDDLFPAHAGIMEE